MRRYRIILPILFTTSALAGNLPACAMSGDVLLNTLADIESPSGKLLRYYPSSGVATMHFRDSVSISGAAIEWDYNCQSQAFLAQTGSGYNMYRIKINSYHKLAQQKSTVWGHAGFTAGNTNDVKFADCIDYNLVAPYVLGDDTGGDLTHQQYVFGGGWSRCYGEWATGISADYRAEIAHRSHDPRIRDIVSDLGISIGCSHSIGERYRAAIDGSLRIYHQDCDIDYYNPANTIMTRLLTGMGSVYSRFDNNQCNSSGHRLTGIGAGISVMPQNDATGLRARIAIVHNSADMELRDFNNITLGTTSTNIICGSMTWFAKWSDRFSFLPTFTGRIFDRTGIENLFGTSSGSSYEKVGSRKSYTHSVTDMSVLLPVEWKPTRKIHSLYTSLRADYSNNHEQLTDRHRSTEVNRISLALNITGMFRCSSTTMITAGIDGIYSKADAKTPQWGDLDFTTGPGKIVKSNYDMACSNSYSTGTYIKAAHAVAGKVMNLTAAYIHKGYSNTEHSDNVTITLSLNF